MNIINDFFYTVWKGEPVCAVPAYRSDPFLQRLFESKRECFLDNAAIVLTISSANVLKYLQVKEAVRALNYFSEYQTERSFTHAEISAVQCRLLSYLQLLGDMAVNKAIGQRIEKLRKASVIGYDTARKLISILTLIPKKHTLPEEAIISLPEPAVSEETSYYERASLVIEGLTELLEAHIELPQLKERLFRLPAKLKAQKFSIGITGVMNAGKSTMLNALLGKEILGTAIVPETANLTVIRYADQPGATVHFWNTREWQQIVQDAEVMEGMAHFVEETVRHFGRALDDYITEEGRSEAISVEALPSYTSAAHSDKRCNLVKSVTLSTDLEFVQQGVEIVDTPGLDDPVVQREEITRSYLAECDLLCHLMNVGQSATKKDVDFIIESLLYRNVAQLLVVITRIDTVSEAELAEVIAYTRSSIRQRLEALDQGSRFEALIARIVFVPIAGKMALLHRTGRTQEALAEGYDLEKSGIPRIEAYLREVLFGKEAPKARLLMEAAGKELTALIRSQEKAYSEEKVLLGKSTREIEAAYADYQAEAAASQKEMEKIYREIEQVKQELARYCALLQKASAEAFGALQVRLRRRIMDDVRYTLRKEKRKPAPERIETMIATGLQDGLIDLLRDYRYGFQKRMEEGLERIAGVTEGFVPETTQSGQESAKTLFEGYFDAGLLTGSSAVLSAQVNRAIAKSAKKELEQLDRVLQRHFTEALNRLKELFEKRTSEMNGMLLEMFEARCKAPLEQLTLERESRGEVLTQALRSTGRSSEETRQRLSLLTQRLSVLAAAQAQLRSEGIV